MKVLILTCNTGEGHNHAAYAIAEELTDRGIPCEIADPVGFRGERAKKLVAGAYNGMIKKVPRAFNAVYRLGELYSDSNLPSPIYFANSLYAQKLKDYILESGFDRIVCTHLYAMEAMTAIGKKYGCHIPCFGVLTDYTCVPFFAENQMDGYFIPHEGLCRELVEKGLLAGKAVCHRHTGKPQVCLPAGKTGEQAAAWHSRRCTHAADYGRRGGMRQYQLAVRRVFVGRHGRCCLCAHRAECGAEGLTGRKVRHRLPDSHRTFYG